MLRYFLNSLDYLFVIFHPSADTFFLILRYIYHLSFGTYPYGKITRRMPLDSLFTPAITLAAFKRAVNQTPSKEWLLMDKPRQS